MALAEKRNKDQAMAGRMKQLGIERTSGRCACCYRLAANGSHPSPMLCALPALVSGRKSRAVKVAGARKAWTE